MKRARTPAAYLSNVDPILAKLIAAAGPYTLRLEAGRPPFQHLARAIAHQQLNGTAANTILTRFVALYPTPTGGQTETPFPSPEQVLGTSDEHIRATGFSFSKIAALKDLAQHTLNGVVPDFTTLQSLDNDEIVTRLTKVRGVGPWTVQMMLIFQLGRPDVLPVGDFGVCNGFRLAYGLRGMPKPKALAEFGARWAPHRTAAAWYLWRAVDLHRAGKLPNAPMPAPRIATIKPKPRSSPKTTTTRRRRAGRARHAK